MTIEVSICNLDQHRSIDVCKLVKDENGKMVYPARVEAATIPPLTAQRFYVHSLQDLSIKEEGTRWCEMP